MDSTKQIYLYQIHSYVVCMFLFSHSSCALHGRIAKSLNQALPAIVTLPNSWRRPFGYNLNQSTVSTAKRLGSLFWYLIASTIDTLHRTINGYENACIWDLKYNVHVCMIQTNADFIFQKLIVFVSCWL